MHLLYLMSDIIRNCKKWNSTDQICLVL